MHGFDFLGFPENAVAVVTGAASGIGRAIADQLLAAGVAVSGWDLSAEAIAAWQTESGDGALGLVVDVTDESSVAAAFASTAERLGPVGFLVNNAGPASGTDFEFTRGLAVAAGSMELVTRSWLATAGSTDGHIVNISSVAGNFVGVGAPWYPAAKAAIAGYTRSLAVDRPNGIRANAIAPGIIETPRTAAGLAQPAFQAVIARNPFGRPGVPLEVANAVVFLLSPAAGYINGVVLPVDGGTLVTQ
jgi:NAD(P)-dependent dehydrogenase (short-subunit alcohol dehydrogenase family)